MNTKYQELLNHFRVYPLFDGLLETAGEKNPRRGSRYVTMDAIHTATILVGVQMDKPLSFYIKKACSVHIDTLRRDINLETIIECNRMLFKSFEIDDTFNFSDYDFSEDELQIVYEVMNNIPAYRSKITRRQYSKLFQSIREKVKNSQ